MPPERTAQRISERLPDHAAGQKRRLIALVGPPASGKSTLADALAGIVPDAAVVAMDGFHLDNGILDARNLRHRKGAPETFDVAGLKHLLDRLRKEDEVFYPVFDRDADCAVAGAAMIQDGTTTVIVEGNYLLLDMDGWRDLADFWDFSILLNVAEDTLRGRLMRRWDNHGYSRADAIAKTEANDLPNARLVAARSSPADLVIENA